MMTDNTSALSIFSDVKVKNGSSAEVFTEDEVVGVVVITTAILILALPANVLVLMGYLNTSTALKKPANNLLVNLTVSEFILTLVVIPLQLLVHFIEPNLASNDGSFCIAVGILTYPFYMAVILSMIFISVDRYYAVRAPLSYKFKISRNRIAYMITYTWIHACGFTFGFGFTLGFGYNPQSGVCGILWDKNMVVSGVGAVTHIVVPFFLLLGLNVNLVVCLRRQNQTAVNKLDNRQNQIWKTRQAQERRITCLVFWIISSYLFCWSPYLITRALSVILSKPTPALISTIATIILQLSVVIDPLLSFVFRKDLRATLERFLLRRRSESITIATGLNFGISRVTERSRNTRIFVRPQSDNLDD